MNVIETENFIASNTQGEGDIKNYYVFRKKDAEFVLKISKKDIKEIEEMIKLIKGEK